MGPASNSKCRSCERWNPIVGLIALLFLLLGNAGAIGSHPGAGDDARNSTKWIAAAKNNRHRKLLGGATERISDTCSKSDIGIFQGHSSPLPNGIPTFTVQIINMCVYDCPISAIHVSCGWFASAKLVNPKLFKRLKFNDCLVNGGKTIKAGDTISFQYANSFQYPMKIQSAQTCVQRL